MTVSPGKHDAPAGHTATLWAIIVVCVLSSIPILRMFYLVATYGVDVPFWDDWSTLPFVDSYVRGTWSVLDLFAQNNEHRHVTGRLTRLVFVSLTDWNLKAEMIFSVVVAVFTFLLLARLIIQGHRSLGASPYGWLIVLTSVLVFSPVQRQNFQWAFQVPWFLHNCSLVGCVMVAVDARRSWWHFCGALLLACAATFSVASGLCVWPIVAVHFIVEGLYIGPRDSRSIIRIGVWLVCFLLVTAGYFFHYASPGHHPSLLAGLKDTSNLLTFFLAYLGSPVLGGALVVKDITTNVLAGCMGLAALCVLASVWWKWIAQDRRVYYAGCPWFLLACFTMGAGIVTSASRMGLSMELAVSSRYTTIVILFWAALCVLANLSVCYAAAQKPDRTVQEPGKTLAVVYRRVIPIYVVSAFALATNLSVPDADWQGVCRHLSEARTALSSRSDEGLMLRLTPEGLETLVQKDDVLRKHRLSLHRSH